MKLCTGRILAIKSSLRAAVKCTTNGVACFVTRHGTASILCQRNERRSREFYRRKSRVLSRRRRITETATVASLILASEPSLFSRLHTCVYVFLIFKEWCYFCCCCCCCCCYNPVGFILSVGIKNGSLELYYTYSLKTARFARNQCSSLLSTIETSR